jgi:hypothetical protein
MHIDLIPVQAIKSISQRSLALHWLRLHAKSGLPQFADFSPGDRTHDPRQMLVWTFDEQAGERRYRPLYSGSYVYEAFGAGATLAAVPTSLITIFKSGMDACVTSASIIYMTIATSDPAGHPVECERMLLPFANGGTTVAHVLASLQVVSVDGTFHRDTVVQLFAKDARMTSCGRIEPVSPAVPKAKPSRVDQAS